MALENANELISMDMHNQIDFAIRSGQRGAGNARQKANSRKYGKVMVRPLVFDATIANLLGPQFLNLHHRLTAYNYAGFIHPFNLAGTRHYYIGDLADKVLHYSSSQCVRAAVVALDIWFICFCVGPTTHVHPCIMAQS